MWNSRDIHRGPQFQFLWLTLPSFFSDYLAVPKYGTDFHIFVPLNFFSPLHWTHVFRMLERLNYPHSWHLSWPLVFFLWCSYVCVLNSWATSLDVSIYREHLVQSLEEKLLNKYQRKGLGSLWVRVSVSVLMPLPVTTAPQQAIREVSLPGDSDGEESTCNVGDLGLIPGLGRCPGEGPGNPLQYSCLENPMDRGAWPATVRGVAKSQTRQRLSTQQTQ